MQNKTIVITPLEEYSHLAKKVGCQNLLLKREDKQTYGSHKIRTISQLVDKAIIKGYKKFVISSSGNAAISAGMYIKKIKGDMPIELKIMVGSHINSKKLEILQELEKSTSHMNVIQAKNPLEEAFEQEKKGYFNLRQSIYSEALIGYRDLANEIWKQMNYSPITAVFVSASSGTLAQGLFEGFKNISQEKSIKIPQIHVIQTSSCHTLVNDIRGLRSKIMPHRDISERSIADAIVDISGIRREKIIESIEASGGSGWIAYNEEIQNAQVLLKESGIETTPNGALSLAGLIKATQNKWIFSGPVICIISGK